MQEYCHTRKKDFFHGSFRLRILCCVAWLLAFFCSQTGMGQDLAQMKFEVLDEQQGLSNQWITHMALDSSGYVWIGTRNGLNRYDGNTFKIFHHQPDNPSSLESDNGQRIYVHRDGSVWISYTMGGISRYDEDCQCFIKQDIPGAKVKEDYDKDFGVKYIDASGNIWFSGNGLGLNIWSPLSKKTVHYDLPDIHEKVSLTDKIENNTVHFVHLSRQGVYWLCTKNGLYSFDTKTGHFSHKYFPDTDPFIKSKASFNKLIPAGDTGFWISSFEGGLNYFDIKKQVFKNYLIETKKFGYYNLVYDIAVKSKDEFWIASGDRGLGVFNIKKGIFTFNNTLKDKSDNTINFIMEIMVMSNGVILLSDQYSVLKYNPYNSMFIFRYLNLPESQHGNLFLTKSVLELPEYNMVLFGTEYGNGLSIYHTENDKITGLAVETHPKKDKKMRVRSIAKDANGHIWVLSRDYLYKFNPGSEQLIKLDNPFSKNTTLDEQDFSTLLQAPDKALYLLNNAGHLYPFFPEKQKLGSPLTVSDGTQQINHIDFAAFDANGGLWAYGNHKLVQRKKGETHWKFILNYPLISRPEQNVKAMCADNLGNIWLALDNHGILKCSLERNEFKFTLYSLQNGLPDLRIFSMNADDHGNLWIATLSGIAKMDIAKGKFRLYNQSEGMDKFNRAMTFIRGGNQAFYITVPGKYCKVNYQNLEKTSSAPGIYIDAFNVYDKSRAFHFAGNKTATVKAGEDYFSFDFGSIDFTDQSHHHFYYMLEGWDKEWVNAGARRFASYTNLPEGDYRFKVKVMNSEGDWSEIKSVPVKIETFFYRKNWFILLLLLAFAALIFGLYLVRIRIIRASEKMKTAFHKQILESRLEALRSQMNPHFIFNSLNSINRYIIKNDAKTSSLYLTRFSKLMRLVLDNSRHRTIPVSTELEALKLYIELELFRFENKFDYAIEISPEVPVDTCEIPPLIIQPFVENAIWHGLLHQKTKGRLYIGLTLENHFLKITVEDNGVGRKKAGDIKAEANPTRESHGLKLTEERLHQLQAGPLENSVEITDLYGPDGEPIGTRVILMIKQEI